MEAIKLYQVEKYEITVQERENKTNYINYNYQVIIKRYTPKARWTPYKTLKNYVFKTQKEAETYATKYYENLLNNIESEKRRQEEQRRKNTQVVASDHYKENDILVNSWGYEQTNIDFYQVVRVLNKTIEVVEICSEMEEGSGYSHGMACNVLPVKDSFLKDKYLLRVKADGYLSQPKSYYYIHKWDGRPMYNSWYH